MIDNATIRKIAELIQEREDFENTTSNDKDNEEWLHTYNGLEVNEDRIVILSEFDDGIESARQFLIFEKDTETIRDATPREDEQLRGLDDNIPFREYDFCQFIICREADNTISIGGKE